MVGILLVFLTINYQFRFLRGPTTSQSGTVGLFLIFIPNIWPLKTIMKACFEFNTFNADLLSFKAQIMFNIYPGKKHRKKLMEPQ